MPLPFCTPIYRPNCVFRIGLLTECHLFVMNYTQIKWNYAFLISILNMNFEQECTECNFQFVLSKWREIE